MILRQLRMGAFQAKNAPLSPTNKKVYRINIFLGGGNSGHPIAMKPFEYGKSFPDYKPKKKLEPGGGKKCNFAKRPKKPLNDGKKSYRYNQCNASTHAMLSHSGQKFFTARNVAFLAPKLVISKYTSRPIPEKCRSIVINAIFQPLKLLI